MKKGNILLVDDNRAFIDNVKDILEDEGYDIMTGYVEEMGALVQQTINENAYTCLTKPLDMRSLLALLEEVLEARRSGKLTKPGRE